MATLTLQVNGAARTVEVERSRDTPLLYVLRNDLGLTGTKFGCGLAQCGACTVPSGRPGHPFVLDARQRRRRPPDHDASRAWARPSKPDPVQAAFIAEQAPQCGYCTVGLVMTARAFLQQWGQNAGRPSPRSSRRWPGTCVDAGATSG